MSAVGALAGTAGLPLLLEACVPAAAPASNPPAASSSGASTGAAPAGAQPTTAAKPAADAKPAAKTAGGPFPTFIPFTGGPKPDYHSDDARYDDGFDNYPANPFRAVNEKPGAGSNVNVLIAQYFPPPTPFDQNPSWQEVNKQLNANVQMNMVAGTDYRTKFTTTIAGDDLPDIMHIWFGYTLAPNLPAFFKAKCADLTPYLSGDAAKDYPYLAAIPTYAWKNSVSAIDGALYLIPIQRHLPTFPGNGGYFFVNSDMWDKDIGADTVPKNAEDFKKILQTLNKPGENRAAVGNNGADKFLFGLLNYAAMFGAPNTWGMENGKLVRDRETEGYKQAVSYVRDLMQMKVFPPDIATITRSRDDFVAKKFAVSVEGYGNSWNDFWRRGLQQNPQTKFKLLKPFPGTDGGQPRVFMSQGFVSMNVLKKAPPDRIKELLRIMNYLAAPFGSQEDLLLTYGLKDQDYKLDDKGNPVPTQQGTANTGYVPWRYIAQHPWVNYQADIPGYAKASFEAEQALIPIGVEDATNGFYSPTAFGKGTNADTAFYDAVRDIILGRKDFKEYDGLVKTWQQDVGETIRKEYTDAMAAAK
jgi:putative aldouronate transport system substrate-binding protein